MNIGPVQHIYLLVSQEGQRLVGKHKEEGLFILFFEDDAAVKAATERSAHHFKDTKILTLDHSQYQKELDWAKSNGIKTNICFIKDGILRVAEIQSITAFHAERV